MEDFPIYQSILGLDLMQHNNVTHFMETISVILILLKSALVSSRILIFKDILLDKIVQSNYKQQTQPCAKIAYLTTLCVFINTHSDSK